MEKCSPGPSRELQRAAISRVLAIAAGKSANEPHLKGIQVAFAVAGKQAPRMATRGDARKQVKTARISALRSEREGHTLLWHRKCRRARDSMAI